MFNLTFVCLCKHSVIMAIDLIFTGSENSETEDHKMRVFHNTENEIFIEVDMDNYQPSFIILNKETAIKLSKELRKQISYITESEVSND